MNKSHHYTTVDEKHLKISIHFKDKEKLLANATICLETLEYGPLTIKGFQIWKSSQINDRLGEAINITPPSQPLYGRYITLLFFEDEQKWFKLERRIYDAYCLAKTKRAGRDEYIDPKDVPI